MTKKKFQGTGTALVTPFLRDARSMSRHYVASSIIRYEAASI
jgi:hypothetical protein